VSPRASRSGHCIRGALPALLVTAAAAQSPHSLAPDFLVDPRPYVAKVEASADGRELALDNGLLRATLRLQPDAALVSLRTGAERRELLRAVRPFGKLTLDGVEFPVGGLAGQPNHAFLLPQWLDAMQPDRGAFHLARWEQSPIAERLPWKHTRPCADDAAWPPPGVHVQLHCTPPPRAPDGVTVTVHLELYDGLPLLCQWLEVHDGSDRPVEVDAFTSVLLAVVEAESRVDPLRTGVRLPPLHVETDFAFHAMTGADGSAHCVRWLPDPQYETQVNYERQTRCLLEVRPDLGPAQTVAAHASFATFRTWLLAPDRGDRDRESLALRRMYRTIAPWCTENPLMLHLTRSDPAAVRAAIDQCAAVGFEMVILSFGSGFDLENPGQQNLDRWKKLADCAHGKGIQLGGYSLLSSRRIEPDGDNCIDAATGKPGGQIFGTAPALASGWGQRYFAQLRRFFERTGFDLLEHDGSYPGDADACARPPLQKGRADSQWVQHAIVSDFYRWCRGRGVYLNVPDWYFLQGSSKTGMGYRETNWSLPREQQVIHTRQNLFDGTQDKTPTMGWMFVPLTEYHGGGAPATIEPLAEHLPHYEAMLASNLAFGAQACYRGPRLYDDDATRALVQREVAWFKAHRAILESDVVHGSSRRADGRDLDWILHVNPRLDERALLAVWNPLPATGRRELPLDLHYAGLRGRAEVVDREGRARQVELDGSRLTLPVTVDGQGFAWFVFRRAP
jgi:hypothetical protein